MPAVITLAQLDAVKALPFHRQAFVQAFGEWASVTPEAVASVADVMPWPCAAKNLFSQAGLARFEAQREFAVLLYMLPGQIDGKAFNLHLAHAWAQVYNEENLG